MIAVSAQAPAIPAATDAPAPVRLARVEWLRRRQDHLERARRWTADHRLRASRGEKHPVLDFLFTYYKRRASALERWHPGVGTALIETQPGDCWLEFPGYSRGSDGEVWADPRRLPAHRLESVRWIAALLRTCSSRPPLFGCFGLHEWAMLYRAGNREVRHESTPLRFGPDELAAIVDQLGVRCTHFDAFRFFTPAGRPLNRLQPTRDTRLELEQRGCIHVTMDLYKWAYKLEPFTPGELALHAFEVAVCARELDMRASPYDLRDLGYEPVRIETPEGRAQYEREQRALAARAEPLRTRLLEVCDAVLQPQTRHHDI